MAREPSMMGAPLDTGPEPEEPKRTLWADCMDIRAVLAAEPPELDFVFPGLLAGTIGVLVGAGGTGKSLLSLGIGMSVAAGRDVWGVLGGDPKAGGVLMVSVEDPSAIIARRLHSLRYTAPDPFRDEAALDRLRIKAVHGKNWSLGTWDKKSFEASDALKVFEDELAEFKPRLTIIDTLNRALAGIDENDNAAMGRVISEIERVISKTSTAALLLHHQSKAGNDKDKADEQGSSRGASAITDNARWQANLVTMKAEDGDDRGIPNEERRSWVKMSVPKINYAPPPDPKWLRRGVGGVLAVSGTPAPASGKKTGGRKPNTQGDALDAKIGW
jgi:RecA-family ATPase